VKADFRTWGHWLPKRARNHPKMKKWPPRCFYCKRWAWDIGEPLTLDHIVPKAKGGSNDPTNLRLSCFDCNNIKGKKSVKQFFGRA